MRRPLLFTIVVVASIAYGTTTRAEAPRFGPDEVSFFDVVRARPARAMEFVRGEVKYALYLDGRGGAFLGRRALEPESHDPALIETSTRAGEGLVDAPKLLNAALNHRVAVLWRLAPDEARHYADVITSYARKHGPGGQPVIAMFKLTPKLVGNFKRFATSRARIEPPPAPRRSASRESDLFNARRPRARQ